MSTKYHSRARGAVSLFVVVFTSLLLLIITIGFMRLMMQDQQHATASDVSKSAYDSAQAGVEDAKRALITYRQVCSDAASPECARQHAIINKKECTTLQQLGTVSSTGEEVPLKQQDSDDELQQAYTCVTLQVDSPDYLGVLEPATTRLIPLRGVSSFNQVIVQWFTQSDVKNNPNGSVGTVELPAFAALPKLAEWPQNRPALLRTQFIQLGPTFKLTDFDANTDDGHSDNNTVFLYPASAGRTDPISIINEDVRRSSTNGVLQQVACRSDFTTNRYACQATVALPQPIGQTDDNRGAAYIRIDGLYNQLNNFRIQLAKDGQPVSFAGVQAIVDSTGRASDQFRRVQSRIEVDTNSFPYPRAAIDITGNLCKNFMVTDSANDYVSGSTVCDPATYTKKKDKSEVSPTKNP